MPGVRVEAPARLHLGMLAVAGDGARRFGGLGVSVGRPAVVLEAEPADELSAEGADAERALTFAHRCRDALGLAGGAHLRVVEAIPQHVGLGSGTKLALAVAQALATLEGRDVDAPGLAEAAGRAARSAVGMWTFAVGGLVVEGGHRLGVERPAPLLARHPMPEEWRAVLVVPAAAPGLSGGAEEDAFGRLVPAPERSAVIAQLVLTALLPALVERELEEFGTALTRIQQQVGDSFAAGAGRAVPSASGRARRGAAALRGGGRRPELMGTDGLRGRRQRGGRTRAGSPHGGPRRRRGERGARGVRQPRRPRRAVMKLLVSVADAGEARVAAAAGAEIVDVKNPAEGSLGAPSPAVIAAVRAAVPAELPVSAAIGDMPNLPGTAALAALGAARSGATFVKVGLWGVSTEDDAVDLLRAVHDGVANVPGAVVVAAAYGDARRVAHAPLPPELLPRVARAAGVGACLLDTAVKDGRGLLEWLSPDALAALVADAHAAGLQVALAGALRAEDLPVVRDAGADIAGVRSAACRDGRRSGRLDAARVRALVAACAATPPRAFR